MSRHSHENPDEPEFDIDDVLDRTAARAIDRKLIAQADEAEKAKSAEQRRSESEQRHHEELLRAETESGSDWDREDEDQ